MYKHLLLTALACITMMMPFETEAARRSPLFSKPRILSRMQWNADESFGISNSAVVKNDSNGSTAKPTNGTDAVSEKVKKCRDVITNYPEDFHVDEIDYNNRNGKSYIWPRRYSPKVKTIVVHHTGEVQTEERRNMTGPQRVRAIYKGHSTKNGWGDIGYHFLIDKEGMIYEGRDGGSRVVGAHVYCANVGTIAVAMIGNFQNRYPTEKQLSSLRWLLSDLSVEYDLRPNGRTMFQGKSMPTIVAHRDLAATQCAGRRIQSLLPKIRRLVAARDFSTPLLANVTKRPSRMLREERKLKPVGSTLLRLPPRGALRIQLNYSSGDDATKSGESIANVSRSDSSIGLWQERNGSRIRVRNDIRAERKLNSGERTTLTLHILAPRKSGTYTLKIGNNTYTLDVTGRRMRR